MVDGTFTNNGFIIVADTEFNDRFNYRTSDASAGTKRPKLVVQYTLPQGRAPSNNFAFVNYIAPKAQPALLQQGGTYSKQPDPTEGEDTYLLSTSPTTNNGTDVGLGVGESNNAANRFTRSLIKFDLSSIPANAAITSATLSLWTSQDLSDNPRTIRVYRLKTPFNETQATWNIASTGVNWQSPGASGANDRESDDIGSVPIPANEAAGVEKQIALSATQIQEMVNGAFTNNGFIIIADTEFNDRFNYRSSDASNASQRPKLVIQYTIPPTATPTPTPTVTPSPTATETPSATPVATDTPSITPTATQTPPPQGPVTITYDYDSLYRLTAADYSTSDYYHYSYDAVGNRKTQDTMVGGLVSTDSYNYDDANRLIDVDGVLYSWDDNGNLLSDGINTYTYDSANRLKTITGASTATFAYNGLGDRLVQNGVNYTVDLNAGLTQVLSDGTNTYLYGVGRIAQAVGTSTEYFLSDALGSVRQLTNTSGDVTLARSYAPYGNLAQSAGSALTSYGFTGEFTDASGLVYLRARYYATNDGRFLTRDTWEGDTNRPMSYNVWLYVYGNPVNLTDPSGHDPHSCEGRYDENLCIAQWKVANGDKLTADDLKSIYNVFPDETLRLLQQQFRINIPLGYQFRLASRGSTVFPRSNIFYTYYIFGAGFWFTELHGIEGTIFEFSSLQCGLFSSDIPSQATHIDYSIYITDEAFTHYDFYPDDIAGNMIHEAVHAWQESLVRDNLSSLMAAFSIDPRSLEWAAYYKNGMERQAQDITNRIDDAGIINLSQTFIADAREYRSELGAGPDDSVTKAVGFW